MGRYVLYEAIGSGGMGEVHRARVYAAAGVVKELGIKRVRRERLESEASAERFIEEARVWMGLTHAHIVSVFDFGRAGEEYFLAMEWVDGSDLRGLIGAARQRGCPFPVEVVAHVGACVARALSYAHGDSDGHRAPIVHGDVKPANVLVSRSGEVKLTDFGAAAAVGGAFGAGTPGYMAPEQRERGRADPRSDLFALGVLLREMLTLERPGAAAPPIADAEMKCLVERLLAEDVEERPASAREVAGALELVVAHTRAQGGVDPVEELGQRAAVVAALRAPALPQGEIGPDASFMSDGHAADFVARMTESTWAPPAAAPEPPAHTPRRRPSRRRGAGGALTVALVLAAGAWGLVGWARPELAASPTAGSAAPGTSGVDPGPAVGAAADGAAASAVPADGVTPSPSQHGDGAAEVPAAVDSAQTSLEPRRAPIPEEPVADARPSSHRAETRTRTRPHVPRRTSSPARSPAAADGSLSINALPWAHVYLDGRSVGDTPLFDVALSGGTHRVRLENPALGAERRLEVSILPASHRDVVVDLR